MKKLANVLYITTPEAYLSLDGENVVIKKDEHTSTRLPLHNLENIVCFTYLGVSPALMGACSERDVGLCFLTPNGRFLARVNGKVKGNVLLRKKQYEVSDMNEASVPIAASFLLGKVANCRKVIERAMRDHAMLVDVPALTQASAFLKGTLNAIPGCKTIGELMAFEGSAAKIYFGVFDQLILQQREDFTFQERSRRPPLDNMNSLLSFLYTLLTNDAASALEVVGLDPYVGFLHQDRPGRPSLALDIMEELRPVFADRLALSLVNRKQVTGKGFTQKESGGILMDDETRKAVLTAWQERKKEEIVHPYLKERIAFGLIPHVQAMLLARYLRGDLTRIRPSFGVSLPGVPMMVLITYDVNTETEAGKKRLHKVAKQCENYGQRVQNSVFECIIDPARLKQLQANLEKLIDKDKDSLRYYYLGDEWRSRVMHVGAKASIDLEGTLIA